MIKKLILSINFVTVKYLKFLLLIVSIIFLVICFIAISNGIRESKEFYNYIQKCNEASYILKFSCYRSGIEKYYKDYPQRFIRNIQEYPKIAFRNKGYSNYAIFGTNSHTFYHAAGDFIAENMAIEGNDSIGVSHLLKKCPPISMTTGCVMGLYKRLGLKSHHSTEFLRVLYQQCGEEERGTCAHEIGHLLHDKYTYSILKIVDEISEKQYGLKQTDNAQYVTFKNSNLNMSFEDCKTIISDKKRWDACYTGIGHNLFIFSEFSKDGFRLMFDECQKIKESEKDNCLAFSVSRIGVNEAAPRLLSGQFKEANKVCNDVANMVKRKDLEYYCYRGIGEGIKFYIQSEYGLMKIDEKNIAGIRKDMLKSAKLCEKASPGFAEYCYDGLFGTKFKKLYLDLNMLDKTIEKAFLD